MRAGSFDVKVKSEVAHHRELRTLLGTGVIARQLIAANGRGHIAIAEGEKIHVLDSAPAMGAPAAAAPVERGSLRATAKPSVGFEVLQLNFNSADETQLLVSGLKECVALTLGERGELVSRISIDLMLDALGLGLPVHILRTAWLPGSVSRCYVLTNQFIKVYDLAKDKICPQYYYQVLEDAIKDVAFAPTGADGTLTLLALTGSGVLYRQPLVAESGGGPLALCEKGLTDESVAQVLPLAEYYQVGALKMLCAQHLEKGPATVELLILAKRFALDELYTRGIKRYSRKMYARFGADYWMQAGCYDCLMLSKGKGKGMGMVRTLRERRSLTTDIKKLEELSEFQILTDILKCLCESTGDFGMDDPHRHHLLVLSRDSRSRSRSRHR